MAAQCRGQPTLPGCPDPPTVYLVGSRWRGSDACLRSLSDQPDAYAINGLGPFGLNFALVAADELAELVLHDRQPTLFAVMAQS